MLHRCTCPCETTGSQQDDGKEPGKEKSTMHKHEAATYIFRRPSLGIAIALFLVISMFGGVVAFPRTAAALSTVKYEAERASLTGGVKVDASNSGYLGTGYVDGYTSVGAKTIFTINVPSDGTYAVTLHYANGSGATRSLSVVANDLKLLQTSLPATANWSTWADSTANLTLRAGLNTLSYEEDSGDSGNVSLDYVSIANDNGLASRGATLPYVEYEAERAVTNGTVLGPDRTYLTMASEASGREAVKLSAQGQYVEFTLTQPANAIDIRYSIPDSSDGTGLTAPLSLYINGAYSRALTLTSKYSWVYGSYPYTNNPGDGSAHHFFDETRALLGSTLAAGTKVRLQVDAADTAAYYVIDLADFYTVPAAYTEPASGYISVTSSPYNADPTGTRDSTAAIQNAVNAAESAGEGVWIPAGTYTVTGHITLNNVTVRGAGPWYTILQGAGIGLFGNASPNPSSNVQLYDFSIFGGTTVRNDSTVDSGVGGSLGGGSVIQDIWIEHTKVGIWMDGPSSGLLIVGDTVRDTFADGINLHMGVSNTTVEQTQVRNTGDDGMAMWSQTDADQNDVFEFNTVQLPMLANDFGVYGGTNNSVTDNLGLDTVVVGGGVNVGNRYGAVGLSGTTTIARNTFTRTGSFNINTNEGAGAVWFAVDSGEPAITSAINLTSDEIDSSSYEAIQFAGSANISNVTLNQVTINGAGNYAVQEEVAGSATFISVVATGLGVAGQYNCGAAFTITQGAGNSGWSSTVCGSLTVIPAPPPTGTEVVAINAGGSASGNFVADTDFNAGNQFSDSSTSITTSGVSESVPQAVWQSCRWNSAFTYTISGLTAGIVYTVALDWAELTFQGSGQREFNVALNGNQVLTNFDVYASAGYKTALQKQFGVAANSNGQIVIAFTQGAADNPFVSGVEVWNANSSSSTSTGGTLVTAINAGGGASGNFVADTDYNQGNEYSDTSTSINTNGVSNPAPQTVWQSCRWNSTFTYTIPGLTPGASYMVQLDWAELTFQGAGQREFNVAINGTQVLTNFDVYATTGYKTALAKQFTVKASSSGQIVISFTQGAADNPFISGIEIYTT
jgi:hypothetical protein